MMGDDSPILFSSRTEGYEQNSERIPHPLGWGMRGACCCLIYCLMMDSGAPPQDAAK